MRALRVSRAFRKTAHDDDVEQAHRSSDRCLRADAGISDRHLRFVDQHGIRCIGAAKRTTSRASLAPADNKGFTELAAAQTTPDSRIRRPMICTSTNRLRAGPWSLSVPFPGKALSRDADPAKARRRSSHPPNEPATPFKITTQYQAVAGSPPRCASGAARLRVRAVDLAGNSLLHDDPMARCLQLSGLPRGAGFPICATNRLQHRRSCCATNAA
jgi:hypothetical protein